LIVLGAVLGMRKLLNYIFYTREIKAESLDWSQRAIVCLCYATGEKRASGKPPILENRDIV